MYRLQLFPCLFLFVLVSCDESTRVRERKQGMKTPSVFKVGDVVQPKGTEHRGVVLAVHTDRCQLPCANFLYRFAQPPFILVRITTPMVVPSEPAFFSEVELEPVVNDVFGEL